MPDGNAIVVAVGSSGQLDNVLTCGKGRLEGDHIPAAVREAGDSHIDKSCSGDALCIVGVKCEDLNGDSVVCVGVIGCGVEVQSLEGGVAVCNDAVSVALFQIDVVLRTVNVGRNGALDCLKPACSELFRCFGRYGGGGFSAAVLCAFAGAPVVVLLPSVVPAGLLPPPLQEARARTVAAMRISARIECFFMFFLLK